MPYSYAPQFRAMVIEKVRPGRNVEELARELGVSPATVYRWLRQDRVDRGELAGTSTPESAELRAARRRIAELEAELATVKRASELFNEGRVVRLKHCSHSWRRWLRRGTAPNVSVGCSESPRRGS